MDGSRGPIGGASSQPIADRLAVVIDRLRFLGVGGPVVETIRVDHSTGAGGALADGADINPAALADQELGGAGAEAISLDQRPVCGADVDRAVRVAGGARVVGAAERAAAGAQPGLHLRLRQPQADPEIAAVTAAPMFAHGFAQVLAHPLSPVSAAI